MDKLLALYRQLRRRDFPKATGEFLKKRGLSSTHAKKFSMSGVVNLSINCEVEPDFFRTINQFTRNNPVLITPLLTAQGKPVGFQNRSIKNKSFCTMLTAYGKFYQPFFGLHQELLRIEHDRSVVLVEGVLDVLALEGSPIPAISPLSCSISDRQAEYLSSIVDRVLIMFDNDQSGMTGSRKTIYKLKKKGIAANRIKYPYSDPNELRKNGPSYLEKLYSEFELIKAF